jgi:purine-binding chemotaxis protein CheW
MDIEASFVDGRLIRMDQPLQFLIFSLDDRRYGVPLAQVLRVIRAVDCTPVPDLPSTVLGLIDFHGELLPVLSIRRRFRLQEQEIGVDDAFVIALASKRTVALTVDRVIGAVSYPAPALTAPDALLPASELIDGVVQQPDGLVLIHNLDRFLSLEQDQALEKALTERRANAN